MKCFDIHQGVIQAGLEISNYLGRSCYQLDNRALYLTDRYKETALPVNRVFNCDFVDNGNDSFVLDEESDPSKEFAIVVFRSKQTSASAQISIDSETEENRLLYHRKHVQTRVKIEKDLVTFSTMTAVIVLKPGDTFTVTGTFRKRKKLPMPKSFAELLRRFRSGPVYTYTSKAIERYHFDGSTVRSLLDRFGKPID